MKTLMRNGRDRRSENPLLGHAKKERVSLFWTDQRITSGPAAKRPHSKAEYMTAPERFADSQIPLAPRAPSIHEPKRRCDAAALSKKLPIRPRQQPRRMRLRATIDLRRGGFYQPWRSSHWNTRTVTLGFDRYENTGRRRRNRSRCLSSRYRYL